MMDMRINHDTLSPVCLRHCRFSVASEPVREFYKNLNSSLCKLAF